jgi:hypothetical protein
MHLQEMIAATDNAAAIDIDSAVIKALRLPKSDREKNSGPNGRIDSKAKKANSQ